MKNTVVPVFYGLTVISAVQFGGRAKGVCRQCEEARPTGEGCCRCGAAKSSRAASCCRGVTSSCQVSEATPSRRYASHVESL